MPKKLGICGDPRSDDCSELALGGRDEFSDLCAFGTQSGERRIRAYELIQLVESMAPLLQLLVEAFSWGMEEDPTCRVRAMRNEARDEARWVGDRKGEDVGHGLLVSV